MAEPLISIIVPVYNTEKYLPKCLDSLINQSYKNIEIICINDGSPDNSKQILQQFALKDQRIIIVDKKNGGLSDARNKGLEYVNGDYLMYVDSDDWIDRNTCKEAISKILEFNVDIVMWDYIREYSNRSLKKNIFTKNIYFDKADTYFLLYRRLFGLYGEELAQLENADAIVTVWGKLYKTSLIKTVKFINTNLVGTEDAIFNIEVFNKVNSVYYIHKYFSHYRKDNEVSLTSNYKPELYNRWNNLFNLMSEQITLNSLDYSFKQALDNRIALSIIGLGLNEISSNLFFIKKIKNIGKIINSKSYRNAILNLNFKYFPIKWKIFFLCVKYKFSICLYLLLKLMSCLR